MARSKQIDSAKLRGAVTRANVTLLLTSVLLFQFTGMLLLPFKTQPVDFQALTFALVMPSVTWLIVKLFPRFWPVDRALLILTLFLCSISLVALKAIARSPETPFNQAVYICGGLFAMAFGIEFIRRLRNWDKWAIPLAILCFLVLCLPLAFGKLQYGAKNWLRIGSESTGISLQPSEFVKLGLLLVLSARFASQPRFKKCLPTLLYAASLCVILLLERDLGAMLLYYLVTVTLYYVATRNLLITCAGLGMGAMGSVAAYRFIPIVADRVNSFINPWSDAQGLGWQVIQSMIAISSGGLWGMGLGLGYPRNIPLYHSDFIFAAIGEEFGLVFALGLLAIYVLILLRGVSIAMSARTSFHALLSFGIVALLGLQTFVIVGGNIKLLPLTGVTLPFVSAGGSSMVSMMGAMGMLLGVSSINANDEADDLARLEWREAGRL